MWTTKKGFGSLVKLNSFFNFFSSNVWSHFDVECSTNLLLLDRYDKLTHGMKQWFYFHPFSETTSILWVKVTLTPSWNSMQLHAGKLIVIVFFNSKNTWAWSVTCHTLNATSSTIIPLILAYQSPTDPSSPHWLISYHCHPPSQYPPMSQLNPSNRSIVQYPDLTLSLSLEICREMARGSFCHESRETGVVPLSRLNFCTLKRGRWKSLLSKEFTKPNQRETDEQMLYVNYIAIELERLHSLYWKMRKHRWEWMIYRIRELHFTAINQLIRRIYLDWLMIRSNDGIAHQLDKALSFLSSLQIISW